MEIIAYLTGFLLFCLALLALPVDLSFTLKKEETLDYRAELGLLFGLVTVDLSKKEKKPVQRVLPKKPQKKPKSTKPHLGSVLGNKKLVKRTVRLVRDLLHSLQIEELKLHCRIGLGDPAYTGMLFGLLNPLLLPTRNITLNADFQEAVFEGYCKAKIRIFPIRVIGFLLAFIFSPATMGAVRTSLLNRDNV
jgi:hypothetical protein